MSDPEIIQRVLSGEKEAFSILVKKYQNAIHGIAFHTTQNTHDAEDIAQETFMEAFHRLPTLKELDKFASWLRAIANNLCASWVLMSRLSTLQAAAKEGIIADDLMYQLLETRYEFEEGECLRGESQVYTYQLLSAHDLSSPTIPLIGRHAELELLKAEVEKLLLGGSSFILLIGEAGIGKTRLVTELREHYSDAPLFWLQGKCSQDGYISYAPIVEALNAYFTTSPSTPCEGMGVRLRDELMRFDMENAIPYLSDFLSLHSVQGRALPIDTISPEAEAKKYHTATAEQIRYRTFMALRDWLTNMADIHPIIFVIEDFHWVDKPTLELLKYLAGLAGKIPILFLYVQRRWHENPFDELTAAIHDAHSEGYQQIDLNRLSREQSRRLLLQICSNLECANKVCGSSRSNNPPTPFIKGDC